MDNKKMMWVLAIVWLASFYLLWTGQKRAVAPVQVTPPAAVLQNIEEDLKRADNDQQRLQAVAGEINRFAGNKAYAGTEYVARARLLLAVLQETRLDQRGMLGLYSKPGEKQEHTAVLTYKALLKDFPPEKSEVGKTAEENLRKLEIRLDQRGSEGLGYKLIDFLVRITGRNPKYSYFLALLIITIAIKVLTTPLSRMQFKSMKEMQRIQPLVKELQEKYKGDQRALGEKTMALYKEHGVNPFASCLPLLLQLPILMLLYYKIIQAYSYQFMNGQFLWIGSSLAHKYPSIVALNLSMPDIPLLVLYVISMFISQKMTVVDPAQAEQQKIMTYTMPIMFAVLLRSFPSALMLYWLLFNVISTVQQYYIMKGMSGPTAPPPVKSKEPEKPSAGAPRPKSSKRRKKNFDALPKGCAA